MIDKDYKIFTWTAKQLEKQFSKETLSKYGKIIAYLYQNGFDLNCEDNEVEEQLSMFNFFNSEDDFNDLKKITNIESDFVVGKKIFTEEIYDIIKNNTYIREKEDNPIIIKTLTESHWDDIIFTMNRISSLFYCKDSEIVGVLSSLKNLNDIYGKIDNIYDKIEKEIKVLTWIKFSELLNNLYSIYIQYGKVKTDQHKLSIASNFNDELYGGIGGFNPNTGEIKCIIGSAVYDVKSCKAGNKTKIKNIASAILKETKTQEDPDEIKYLERWVNGREDNNDYAQQIVVNSLLNGILTLLILKHNINFLNDKRNSQRSDDIRNEFNAILKYCKVDKDYLL